MSLQAIPKEPPQIRPAPTRREVPETGKVIFHAAVFAVALAILISRRPDAVFHAQFWAEDGKYWYADAYQSGWHCLLMPLDGYFNTLSRLVGLFTLLFPFSMAPLVMNLCALVVEILPVHILLSSRFATIPMHMRLAGSLFYLVLPNCYETHAILTNLHWRLAVAGCLLLLGTPQDGKLRKRDVTVGINNGKRVEIVGGLSGGESVVATLDPSIVPDEAVNIVQQKPQTDQRSNMVAETQ